MSYETSYEVQKIIHNALGIPVERNFIGWGVNRQDAIQLAILRQLKRIADHLETDGAKP